MAKKTQHIVPSLSGGWEVRGNGSQRHTFHTKQEAIDAGREISRKQSTDFVVHGRSGQILRSVPISPSLKESEVRKAVRDVSVKSGQENEKVHHSVERSSTVKTTKNK